MEYVSTSLYINILDNNKINTDDINNDVESFFKDLNSFQKFYNTVEISNVNPIQNTRRGIEKLKPIYITVNV